MSFEIDVEKLRRESEEQREPRVCLKDLEVPNLNDKVFSKWLDSMQAFKRLHENSKVRCEESFNDENWERYDSKKKEAVKHAYNINCVVIEIFNAILGEG